MSDPKLDPSYSGLSGLPPAVRMRFKPADYGGDAAAMRRDLAATANMVPGLAEAMAYNTVGLMELAQMVNAKTGATHSPLEPGWIGAFTRNQVEGAIPNGARIIKVATEDGDASPIGTTGTVLGSLSHPDVQRGNLCYFVEWGAHPRMAVAVIGWKISHAN